MSTLLMAFWGSIEGGGNGGESKREGEKTFGDGEEV